MKFPHFLTRLIRSMKPPTTYFLGRDLHPLSRKYGFDRGTPIDRYYIDKFLCNERLKIRGRCMEIGDKRYVTQYGDTRVDQCDVLDVNMRNKNANIYADLRKLAGVDDDTYDCVILTQVLGMIDDYQSVIREIYRVLKPGGSVLVTCSSLAPAHSLKNSYWRFLETSLRFSLEKEFHKKLISTVSYGNVLVGQAFWVGMSQEDLSRRELDYNDPHYPLIVCAVAQKEEVGI